MRAQEIDRILKQIAPLKYAYEGEEHGFIWGDPEKEIDKLGVVWRPTVEVLEQVTDDHIDMLVIHEPLIQKVKPFLVAESRLILTPNKQRKQLLNQTGVVVYRVHSNWDDAPGGTNDVLAATLGIKITAKIPFGRIGTIEKTSLKKLAEIAKHKLSSPYSIVVGDLNKSIQTVATVAGSGNEVLSHFELAKQKGADVYISGDIRDSSARYANELDLSLIDVGGYRTELPGAKNLARILKKNLQKRGVEVIFVDSHPAWKVV